NKHGVSGLNVRPKDARAIAEAIMTITNDETIYRTYSRNAKERYKRMFTKDAMVGKCRKIYENLLDN
ncbi:MAG: glycosyl transferase family 1, partial [Bacteroides sp.]|nr:glycosyl transferase family 1 [Bacteroides sp.]